DTSCPKSVAKSMRQWPCVTIPPRYLLASVYLGPAENPSSPFVHAASNYQVVDLESGTAAALSLAPAPPTPVCCAASPSRTSAAVAVSTRLSSSAITRRRVRPGGIGSRNSRVIRPGRLTKLRRPQKSPELTAAGTSGRASAWYRAATPG